jgi:hypothetical protein
MVGTIVLAAQTSRDLEVGPMSARAEALDRVLELPVDRREPALMRAIAREAKRMEPKVLRGGSEEATHYAAGLIRALAEAKDPATVPILIDYSGRTSFATDGLAALGDTAVPDMLVVARDFTHVDLDERRAGVYLALITVIKQRRLSDSFKNQVFDLGEILSSATTMLSATDIMNLCSIAILSGRPALIRVVEALASDASEWTRRGAKSPGAIQSGQRYVRRELELASAPGAR